MDPLSDVLALLKLRSYVSGGFDASGDWAVQFGAHEGIKFHAVVVGECWVSVDGAPAPIKGQGRGMFPVGAREAVSPCHQYVG